jgi:hypothetical protein
MEVPYIYKNALLTSVSDGVGGELHYSVALVMSKEYHNHGQEAQLTPEFV